MPHPIAPTAAPVQSATTTPAPAQQSATTPPKPEISPEMSALMLEHTRLKRAHDLKTVEIAKERSKWDTEKKTLGEKLKLADEYEQLRRLAPIDRASVARKLWGEKWYEQLTEAQVSGGAPSAEAMAAEMDRREGALREEFAAKEAAETERKKAEGEKAREAELRQRRQQYVTGLEANLKGAEGEYPLLLAAFGDEKRAGAGVFQRIEAKWRENPKAPAMTWKEAADALEGELVAVMEKGASHEKYAARFREKLTAPPTSGGNAQSKVPQPFGSQIQQRTLSNDLTASTQARRAPAISDEERQQRMLAAYDAKLAESQKA